MSSLPVRTHSSTRTLDKETISSSRFATAAKTGYSATFKAS
jgi:hypothetical protein